MIRETFARVDLRAFQNNYETLSKIAPVTAVLKANAYGHGAQRCARALWSAGCKRFAVATLNEGIQIRRTLPDASILILGSTPLPCTQDLINYRFTQTLYSYPYAVALSRTLSAPLSVALKLDSGMHRYGFSCDEWGLSRAESVCNAANLQVTELFSHPATPNDATAWERFSAAREYLDPAKQRLAHFANTATALRSPHTALSTIRCGIGLYGYGSPALTPVLSLYTRVVQIHRLQPGDSVGYGHNFVATRPTRIAVIPIGYGDGFLRAYTDGSVYIHDSPATIVGAVCMDACMVDVTELPDVRAGDPVVLWDTNHPADALSTVANTIPYESLTLLSDRVRRFYIPIS